MKRYANEISHLCSYLHLVQARKLKVSIYSINLMFITILDLKKPLKGKSSS